MNSLCDILNWPLALCFISPDIFWRNLNLNAWESPFTVWSLGVHHFLIWEFRWTIQELQQYASFLNTPVRQPFICMTHFPEFCLQQTVVESILLNDVNSVYDVHLWCDIDLCWMKNHIAATETTDENCFHLIARVCVNVNACFIACVWNHSSLYYNIRIYSKKPSNIFSSSLKYQNCYNIEWKK